MELWLLVSETYLYSPREYIPVVPSCLHDGSVSSTVLPTKGSRTLLNIPLLISLIAMLDLLGR